MIPEDYHALYDGGLPVARAAREQPRGATSTAGRERLAADVEDVVLSQDEITGLPNRIAVARAAGRLSERAETPESAVNGFIRDRRDLWNMTEEDAATVEVRSVSRTGLKTVQLVQRVDGAEVFGSDVSVAVSGDNEVVAVAGQVFPGVDVAGRAARARQMRSDEDAVAFAAFDLSRTNYAPSDFSYVEGSSEDPSYRFYDFNPPPDDPRPRLERPVRVKDVLFPLGNEQFAAGYYLELWFAGFPAFSYVIDAVETPYLLYRKNLSAEMLLLYRREFRTVQTGFAYRVHNTNDPCFRPHDGPAPGTPHPLASPTGSRPPRWPSSSSSCSPFPATTRGCPKALRPRAGTTVSPTPT